MIDKQYEILSQKYQEEMWGIKDPVAVMVATLRRNEKTLRLLGDREKRSFPLHGTTESQQVREVAMYLEAQSKRMAEIVKNDIYTILNGE